MSLRLWGGVVLVLGAECCLCAGQEPARVTFELERAGAEVPRFSIVMGEDGRGVYHAEMATPKAPVGHVLVPDSGESVTTAPALDQTIVFSGTTAARVFELARAADRFHGACESKAKNIAETGTKRLAYAGADGNGACTFNYSEVKPVATLADLFLSVEATLESGRRLAFKRRFDRLGLDAEMITLDRMLDGHQAAEVSVIAPTLRAIANDTELLQRVRLRAAKMLEQAGDSQQR